MTLKHSVKFGLPEIGILFAAIIVESVFRKYNYECVITSVNDGEHMENSLHYQNLAFDCRCKHLPDEATKRIIYNEIMVSLTEDFDVLYENIGKDNQHFHIEYDKK